MILALLMDAAETCAGRSYLTISAITKGDQMELRHLRYFAAVVEAKGYRTASRRFHIAQPALSQAITNLEDEMGLKLFVRRGSGVHLTAAGDVFHKECRQILEQVEFAVAATKRADKGQTELLRIGFIPSATQHFLPQLIREYKQRNPATELVIRELTPAKQADALARGELDVAFTRESKSDLPQYTSRLLFEVPLIAVLPASRTVLHGEVDIKELAGDRFVLLERLESPRLFDSIALLCRAAGFSPRIDSHAYLAESMFMLVEAGQGVAIVPSWARAFVTNGLQVAKLMPETVPVELVLVWKRDTSSQALEAFLDLLQSEFSNIQEKTARDLGAIQPH